jgi:hypothetical protein
MSSLHYYPILPIYDLNPTQRIQHSHFSGCNILQHPLFFPRVALLISYPLLSYLVIFVTLSLLYLVIFTLHIIFPYIVIFILSLLRKIIFFISISIFHFHRFPSFFPFSFFISPHWLVLCTPYINIHASSLLLHFLLFTLVKTFTLSLFL